LENGAAGRSRRVELPGLRSRMLDTTEAVRTTRRTSLRQALTRCVCRMEGARAPGMNNKSEASKWRSHTTPEAVACSVPDLVMSVGITDEVRREHDTAEGMSMNRDTSGGAVHGLEKRGTGVGIADHGRAGDSRQDDSFAGGLPA